MKKISYSIVGLLIMAIGVCLLLRELNLIPCNICFDGWWTLFIIIPCFINFCTREHKILSLLGMSIGGLLLMGQQGILEPGMSYKLLLPTAIIFIGVHTLSKSFHKGSNRCSCSYKKTAEEFQETKYEGLRDYAALCSGQDIDMSNQLFQGANMKAMFGGFNLDLRNAVIEENAKINIQCLFGGVEIYVPKDVNVEVTSNCICGGVDMNDFKNPGIGHKTIYINSSCVFGGVNLKQDK